LNDIGKYNTIQYKTYNAPYVTKMLFVGAEMLFVGAANVVTYTLEAIGHRK